jgi:hypothetical protein
MIPMDPRKAQKLGENWGGAITDSVFGIVDVVKNAPAQKAANNRAAMARNAQIEANNAVTRMNNQLRVQAMQEIAAEQEQAALLRMSPAQRQAYYQAKADAAHAAHRAKVEAERKREEFWEIFWALFSIFVVLPFLIWIGLLIWGMADVMACYNMKSFIPLMRVVCGH